jgi:parallel beta-helix repeat protein
MATTFYVRTGGSDAADGLSPETAFSTIGHAASLMGNPGDQVIVGPGVYAEGNIGPARNGIEGHPMEFLADPTGLETGDPAGSVVIMPPNDMIQTTGFLLLGLHHVVIDGFVIVGAFDAGIQVRSAADGSVNSSNVTIRNTIIRGSVKRGIDIAAGGPVDVEANTALENGSGGISIQGCLVASALCRAVTNVPVMVTVSDNTAEQNGADGISIADAAGGTVEQNQVNGNRGDGILIRSSSNLSVVGNVSVGNEGDGIGIGTGSDASAIGANFIITDNVVRNNRGLTSAGINVVATGVVQVGHNTILHSSATGLSIQASLMPSQALEGLLTPEVSNNTVGTSGADGIFISGSSSAVVQNNVSFSNATTGITLRGVLDSMVVNNLIYANGSDGLGIGTEDSDAPDLSAPNTTILNNTVYANSGWGLVIGNASAASAGNIVLDNIFQLNRNGGITLASGSACNYVSGFNINVDGYGFHTPENAYDIIADPGVVNPAGSDGVLGGDGFRDDDFRLPQFRGGATVNSPAVDAGFAPVTQVGITGSTASNDALDVGVVDIGYHYDGSDNQHITVRPPYMPLFVRQRGNDNNDGLDPQRAVASIQEAARRALAGVTVVVGPGRYFEGDIHPVQKGGRVAFFADETGMATGDFPGVVLIDASGKDTGFVLLDSCGITVDGFHLTGAVQAAIQVRAGSDGAQIRNNVAFSNASRGIEVLGADACEVRNNLAYANGTGGLQLNDTQNSIVENNTSYGNQQDGILVGGAADTDAAPGATVVRNVVADNGKGIHVQPNSLSGYVTGFNVVATADGKDSTAFAGFTPRADSDFIADPLLANPAGPDGLLGDAGFLDDDFHLLQGGSELSPAVDVDFGQMNTLVGGSTRTDGLPDLGPLDAGYHFPFLSRAPGSDAVSKVVFVRTTGSDSNSGSAPGAAFATIRKAIAAVSGNGVVVVGSGRYTESGLRFGGTDGVDGLPVVLGDQSGELTGDAPGPAVLDAGGRAGPLVTGPTLIDGVQFTGARGPGLRVLRRARGVTIRNSTICGNSGDGLVTRGDSVNVTNNLVCSNGSVGINVELRRTRGATQLLNNTVAANRAQGIVVWELNNGVSHALVFNNITSGNGAAGLTLRALRGGAPFAGSNLNTDGYGRGTRPAADDVTVSPQFAGDAPRTGMTCRDLPAFRLSPTSPAIDAGRGTAMEIGLGNRGVTSATAPDTGPVDLGYHYPLESAQ